MNRVLLISLLLLIEFACRSANLHMSVDASVIKESGNDLEKSQLRGKRHIQWDKHNNELIRKLSRKKREKEMAQLNIDDNFAQEQQVDSNVINPSKLSYSTINFPLIFCHLGVDNGVICPEVRRGVYLDQYYYDPENNRCYHFIYNGCGGNANRFPTIWQCIRSCVNHVELI